MAGMLILRLLPQCLDAGLYPILCIGETKTEYEAGLCKSVCSIQLSRGLAGVTKEEMSKITIAYEPVWAIGTGLVGKRSMDYPP